MARRKIRKKDDGIIDVLLDSPWQVSVIFSIVAFILLQWIIPSQFSHNLFLAAFVSTLKSAAPFTLLFLIPGLLVYIKQKLNKAPHDLALNINESSPPYTNTAPNYSQDKSKEVPLVDPIKTPRPSMSGH